MKKRTVISGAVLAVAVLAGTAGSASASIPDSGGVIHACYAVKDGALSVIDTDAGQTCPKGTTPLDWNQAGPQGPAGATGPAGPQGTAGPQGPAGVSGYQVVSCGLGLSCSAVVALPGFSYFQVQLPCPSGKTAISASYQLSQISSFDLSEIVGMTPSEDGTSYTFTYDYQFAGNHSGSPPFNFQGVQGGPATGYVTCANASP